MRIMGWVAVGSAALVGWLGCGSSLEDSIDKLGGSAEERAAEEHFRKEVGSLAMRAARS